MQKKKIHIFCLKPPICELIKKRFASSNYLIWCTNPEHMRDNLFKSLEKNVDCIIIDKDIKPDVKQRIKNHFRDVPIICLPSLDSDSQPGIGISDDEEGVKNISEPLRLSELAETLDDIFMLK
jgi:vacuolar-type H+-ATPase subunit F/Vma7